MRLGAVVEKSAAAGDLVNGRELAPTRRELRRTLAIVRDMLCER
jgi:hypothetical protein